MTKEELGGSDIQRAPAPSMTWSTARPKPSRARGGFSPICRRRSTSCRRAVAPTDDPARRDEWLIEAVPRDRRKVYDMRRILEAVVDQDSLFEMGRKFGGSVITALARLDGWPVAVLASDPYFYGGGWTADASQKVARFVDLANTFHLPVVHLVDCRAS